MEREFVVLERKVFKVELLSQLDSTNYGWCISSIPKGIVCMGTENVMIGGMAGNTMLQSFFFGVVSSEEINVDIEFARTCWSDVTKVVENFTAKVRIVPCDSADFVSYSENETNVAMPYGFAYVGNNTLKYGYPY